MTNMKKRILSGILAATMLVMTCGCKGGNTNGDEKEYDSFISVTVFDTLANYEGIQSGWFAKIVKDKFNMELNIVAPNVSADKDSMYLDRFASGNIGDLIICGNSGGQLQEMVDAGLVIDMSSYLMDQSIMQTYATAIHNLNDSIESNAMNGIYAIPTSISTAGALVPSDADTPNFGCYLRYDLYEQIGSPVIETLEDVLEVAAQMKEICPTSDSGKETYAFSLFGDWDGNMTTFAKQPACFYGYDELGFVLMSADGTDCQSILDRDGLYYRSLKFFYTANQMGLVDPNSPSNTYSDVFSKTKDGQVLSSPWPWLGQSAYNTAEHLNEDKAMMFVPIADEKIYCSGSAETGSTEVVVCIGNQAKDPQRLADFIDWLYSAEGIACACAQGTNATAGPKGLTWEMTEEGPVLTEFGTKALLGDSDVSMPQGWGDGTWANGVCQLNFTPISETEKDPSGYPYYYRQWDSVRNADKSAIERRWMETYDTSTVMDYVMECNQVAVAPATNVLRQGENTELAAIRKQCAKLVTDYSWKMMYAEDEETFEALFTELCSRANSCGYEAILAFDLISAKELGEARQAVAAQEAQN